MAYGYVRGDREQLFLLPPSMLDWLEEGHLAYFLIDAVALLDCSAFCEIHLSDGPGRPAYDPEMMLTLLLYAYATGMRSSRAIEAACRSDLAFRVICVNLVPHFTTIARFRAEHEEAIESIFVEVLKLCHAAGLASLGQIAIDGTKIGSDAALDRNRDGAWVRAEIAKILGEASEADAATEAEPGLFPVVVEEGPLRRRSGRLARLRAALSVIEAHTAARAAEAAEREAHAAQEAADGRKVRGRKPKRGYPSEPTRLPAWTSIPEAVGTTRVRRASSSRGFPPTRTVWTTWHGCAGRRVSFVRGARTRVVGSWLVVPTSVRAA